MNCINSHNITTTLAVKLTPYLCAENLRSRYELSNHLGNVLAVVSDKRRPVFNTMTNYFTNFEAVVMSAQDYYPFGMLMPARSYNNTQYRFGFNGQEKDDEITGTTGSHLDFKFRIYDSRIGRFMSIDPLTWKYPFYSPYQFSSNSPILACDLEGLETSYRLNFNEGSVEIIDGKLDHQQLKNINNGRYGFAGPGIRKDPQEGELVGVWVEGAIGGRGWKTNDQLAKDEVAGSWMWIRVGKTQVVKVDKKIIIEEHVIKGTPGTPGTPGKKEVHGSISRNSKGPMGVYNSTNGVYSNANNVNLNNNIIRAAYEDFAINSLNIGTNELPGNSVVNTINIFFGVNNKTFQNEFINKVQALFPDAKINSVDKPIMPAAGLIEITIDYTIPGTPGTPAIPGTPDQKIINEKEETTAKTVPAIESL